MNIRRARIEDAEHLHRAHMRSIQEVCSKDHTPEEISGWGHRPFDSEKWTRAIADQYVWVVETDSKILGYSHLFKTPDPQVGYIYGLYLTPEALGHGMGRKLVDEMFAVSKSLGFKCLELHSTLTAHGFYKRMGFKDSGPMSSAEIGGSAVRCFPMRFEF